MEFILETNLHDLDSCYNFNCYFNRVLGQFTRNYTQTVKRAADNKRRDAPGEGSIPPGLLSGVSKGGSAPFGTRLCGAKCSVLYALSALP